MRRDDPCLSEQVCWGILAFLISVCLDVDAAPAAASDSHVPHPRLVVVLYPHNNDGSPGNILVDQCIREVIGAGSSEHIEIHNEYLDVSHPRSRDDLEAQSDYLRRKYAGRDVDVVIAGLSSALDFLLEQGDVFPDVPVVFCAVDEREVSERKLPANVIGVPSRFDLIATLELALRLHPETQTVAVVTGAAPMDRRWEEEARSAFQRYSDRLEFKYLAALPLGELVRSVSDLPEESIVYYVHVFQDGFGRTLVPAHVLQTLAEQSKVPIYGHVDTYVGRGIVGGRVFSFEVEGRNAARLALRVLAGEQPEKIGVQPASTNIDMFDARQLSRWNIREAELPPGSVVRFRTPGLWEQYLWQILGVAGLCVLQTALILALLIHRRYRRNAEQRFRRAVDAAPNGMLMVDRDGTIVLANAEIERIFGYERGELLGCSVERVLPESLRELHANNRHSFFAAPVLRAMGAGQRLSGRRSDGTTVPVEIGLSALNTDRGPCVLASVVDVTERRRSEEQLRTNERQLQQLSNSLIDAQETERRRIARELHDDYSQSLALLSVELDLLRQQPAPSDGEVGQRIALLSDRVRELSSSMHELSHELHPLKLEQLGLVTAIRSVCQEFSENHDVAIDFTAHRVPDRLPGDIALCLYRIVQEGLRNVVKHSGARTAAVRLEADQGKLSLAIADTGRGFDARDLDGHAGLGLISMRERLRLVGGTFSFESGPSRGTEICVNVPLIQTATECSELHPPLATV